MIQDNEMKDNLLSLLEISLGKKIMEYMNDKDIIEIMKNDDGKVFGDSLTKGEFYICDMDSVAAENIVKLVANHVNQEVTPENPLVSAELPGSGFRFEGNIPPVSKTSAFNIRKHSSLIFTLDDYVNSKIMTQEQANVIKRGIKDRKNILVVGGTKSGKTTLCNALLEEIAQYNQRVIIIQDTNELQCNCENVLYLRATETVPIRRLLTSTLRRTPTRIVIGEVRDGAALNILKAWNTGHPGGVCTLHADSAERGLLQLESYIMEVSRDPQRDTIARTVNMVINLQLDGLSRKVKEIIELEGYDYETRKYLFKQVA